jgi:DAACS family dicarboxylate/amino acid:cation (Na+ or H+) symporter
VANPRDARKTRPKGFQLHTKILLGLVLGSVCAMLVKVLLVGPESVFGASAGLSHADLVDFGERWIEPFGKLFIRAIILTVVPLVFTSITIGIHGLGDLRALGRMGSRTLMLFIGTAFAGACMATLWYLVFQPGDHLSAETVEAISGQFRDAADAKAQNASAAAQRFEGSLFQILLSLVPENLVSASSKNNELLKVILFAVVFGISLTLIDQEKAKPVAKLLEGINEAMIKIIGLMMKLAPYGVFALVFMVVLRFGSDVLIALALYTGVVLLALFAHLVVILLPLVRILGGWGPIAFLRATKEIWVTAFSTSSSSATLPTTMRVVEEKLGVPRPVSSFVLPLGATVNMDGTTIYQIIAVHFVAQVWGVPLDAGMMLTLVMVAMLMAIGAAGVPGGVIPLLYVVMATVQIPEEAIPQGIALILGMDRVLDMCRSSLNVIGDSATATIIAARERGGASPPT